MELEHYRKAAKRLLRALRAGEPEALGRAHEALGERARERFQLSDAQHVVAVEHGHRSWPQLKHALERAEPEREAARRAEAIVDTGLAYRPGEPVRLRVRRRERRITVSDAGAALALAGRPAGWRAVAAQLERALDVNVSGTGAVWLPVVSAGPPLPVVEQRIAAASLAFYQDLLDSGRGPGAGTPPGIGRASESNRQRREHTWTLEQVADPRRASRDHECPQVAGELARRHSTPGRE